MKKTRFFAVVLLVVMSLCMAAQAVDTRAVTVAPQLTFSGTTANCVAACSGNNSTDKISATLTLYQGGSEVTHWTASGTRKVSFNKTYSVKSGKSYKLTLTYSVNGVSQSSKSTTATCP